jgi:hypothetical protein
MINFREAADCIYDLNMEPCEIEAYLQDFLTGEILKRVRDIELNASDRSDRARLLEALCGTGKQAY